MLDFFLSALSAIFCAHAILLPPCFLLLAQTSFCACFKGLKVLAIYFPGLLNKINIITMTSPIYILNNLFKPIVQSLIFSNWLIQVRVMVDKGPVWKTQDVRQKRHEWKPVHYKSCVLGRWEEKIRTQEKPETCETLFRFQLAVAAMLVNASELLAR